MKHILLNNKRLIHIEKIGKINHYILENNVRITNKQFVTVETECPSCLKIRAIKKLHWYNLYKATDCKECKSAGSKNSFFGKAHSQKSKNKIGKKNQNKLKGSKNPMHGKSLLEHWTNKYGKTIADKKYTQYLKKLSDALSGANNPFYGQKHTEKTLSIIKQKNQIYREHLSQEQKEKISQKLSESQKQLYNKNPQDYIAKRSKAGKITAAQTKKYKINRIEQIVYDRLKEMGLDFEYSVILDYKQFDFGSKKHKILLEVQGDYWHGNPILYTKKQLNDIQKRNIKKDKDKAIFAKEHSIKLYSIWETDIKTNNFTVLEEIKNEIRTRTDI